MVGSRYDVHEDLAPPPGLEEVRFLISSGCFFRSTALREVDGFDETFFLDLVDQEICLRLRRRGWRLMRAGDLVLTHTIGEGTGGRVGRIAVRRHPAWRRRLMWRNGWWWLWREGPRGTPGAGSVAGDPGSGDARECWSSAVVELPHDGRGRHGRRPQAERASPRPAGLRRGSGRGRDVPLPTRIGRPVSGEVQGREDTAGRRAAARRSPTALFTRVVSTQSQGEAVPAPGTTPEAPGKHVDAEARQRFRMRTPIREWSLRARVLGLVGASVACVLLVLVVLAIPLLVARHQAMEARSEFVTAKKALAAGDFETAEASEKHARELVASAHGHATGWTSDFWAGVPVTSTAVHDGRYLLEAMREADAILRIGVRVFPEAMGNGSKLISGTSVDVPLLRHISHSIHRVGPHLERANAALAQVKGTTPLLGGGLLHDRGEAAGQLATINRSYHQFAPLMAQLPDVLGANGPKSYLISILNPSELRYSGGATLNMSTLHFESGRATFGQSYYLIQINQSKKYLSWPKVPGNTFRTEGPKLLTTATYSPYWQVSGEELLRAWRQQTGQRMDGVIAVDLQALASLFRVTGPMDIPGYGRVDADNLVQTLAGSYDQHPDTAERHQRNSELIPAFRQKLLEGGRFLQKARALVTAGAQRHFFVYSRDWPTERGLVTAGVGGNLSSTSHDYLGTFTQNTNGSKADYWQRRRVSSTVRLFPDGTARERAAVRVINHSPPATSLAEDPRSGYVTRWLGFSLATFLPRQSTVHSYSVNGEELPHANVLTPTVTSIYDRPYALHQMMLAPRHDRPAGGAVPGPGSRRRGGER